tara:strand:+ start:250 stop:966 length:717 start_codon:yes stop_codon:yes gene_type:complete
MSKNNIKLIMENWNNFVNEQENEMNFSAEEVADFDDKESRAERFIKGTGLEDGMKSVRELGYGTPQFFSSVMKEFQNIRIIQDRLKEAVEDVQRRPKRFPRNGDQLEAALKEALANTAKLEGLIRKIMAAPDKNPFASAQAISAYKGENPGGTGQSAQDALGGEVASTQMMDDAEFPKVNENQDPIKQKEAMIAKLKKQHDDEKDPKKKAALKKKLEKLKSDLAGPGSNADQKKKEKR